MLRALLTPLQLRRPYLSGKDPSTASPLGRQCHTGHAVSRGGVPLSLLPSSLSSSPKPHEALAYPGATIDRPADESTPSKVSERESRGGFIASICSTRPAQCPPGPLPYDTPKDNTLNHYPAPPTKPSALKSAPHCTTHSHPHHYNQSRTYHSYIAVSFISSILISIHSCLVVSYGDLDPFSVRVSQEVADHQTPP